MEGSNLVVEKRLWHALTLVVVLGAAVWALAACGDGGTSGSGSAIGGGEEADDGGTFRVALASDPAFIDPLNLQEELGVQVGDCLFDSLVTFDVKTGALLASVAESWSANEDATVWTFHLREGTKFHDGSTVTAADFKYAWERMCNPANLSEISYHLAAVKGYDAMQDGTVTELEGVKAVDETTLEVTLSYGFGDFEYVVGHPGLGPVPKAAVEADPQGFSEMPIGNGPFKMAEPWAHDQYIKVVRFDDYYGGKAHADGVDFMIFQDEDTAYLEFLAGNLDMCIVPSAQIAVAEAEYGKSSDGLEVAPGRQFLWGPEVSTYFMSIKCTDKVLGNVALRQALSLAINRDAIAMSVFEGTRQAATGLIPPGISGYVPNEWPYCKFDREAAKAKLVEAGYPNGEGLPEIALTFNSGTGHEDVMALIKSDWEAIGVNTKLDSEELAQYLDTMDAANYQVARLGWGVDYPIMDNFLYPLFLSSSADNNAFWVDPAVDEALVAARSIADTEERIAAYQAIDRIVGEASPVIPVVTYGHRAVGSDRVRGLVYSPQTLYNLDKAWIVQE